ncbi:MAG: alanine racemase [Planctomycetota bacterium]|nr:alanine racemase [Planctomycetota bacterium]
MSGADEDPNTEQALRVLGTPPGRPLEVDGRPLTELAASFGTPLYVFSAAILRTRLAAVQAALGPRFDGLWSVKANPSVAVTAALRRAGAGAEIASIGELEVALAAGHSASDLRFAGPGKTDHELDVALTRGVGTIHVESLDELQSLADLAASRQAAAKVALRINLPQELQGARMRMGGRSSRFGVDLDQVPEAVEVIRARPHLDLRGLHVYGGTQTCDAHAFAAHARALCAHAARWERELDVRIDELDLGGGFGAPVFQGDPTFDLDAAGAALRELLEEYDRGGRRWFVELGRFLAAPAGVYVARVVRTKSSGGHFHAVADGGMHHAAAPAGLGTIVRRPPMLTPVAPRAGDRRPVTIGGPLCTPADQFCDQLMLPPIERGDLVAVLHAGAYGLTYSPARFLSHASPAEVFVDGGEARVVRARGAATDAIRDQRLED